MAAPRPGRLARWFGTPGGGAPDTPREQALEASIADLRSQLEAARTEAAEARATRREFLAAMHHELRTPLNAILGFGQLLEMSALDDVQRDNLRHVLRGGRHLLQMVNELLEIAELEAGTLRLAPEPVDVAEVLAEACRQAHRSAQAKAVVVQVHAAGAALVRADRHRVLQVALHLLSNAIKFNREGGRVDIRVHRSGRSPVRVAVSDEGAGLSAAQIARLFAPFERLGAADAGIEGTGLGLTLSRGLVRRMGGTIGVESSPGQGATFWFALPAADEVAVPTVPDARPATGRVQVDGGGPQADPADEEGGRICA